jgi:hypothetical protein
MHPALIERADRTRKKIRRTYFKYYWRSLPGHHCLLTERDMGAPIGAPIHPAPIAFISPQMPPTPLLNVRILSNNKNLKKRGTEHFGAPPYFHDNCLLTGLYKQEAEIRLRKDDGNIKKYIFDSLGTNIQARGVGVIYGSIYVI